jgi:hypothetical protein
MVKLLDRDPVALAAIPNPFAVLTLLHRDAQAMRQNPQERLARKIARYRALLRQGYHVEDVRRLIRLMEHVMRLTPDLARGTGCHASGRTGGIGYENLCDEF